MAADECRNGSKMQIFCLNTQNLIIRQEFVPNAIIYDSMKYEVSCNSSTPEIHL